MSGSRRRRSIGMGLGSFAGAVAVVLVGVGASATTVEEPATITREAYFTYPLTEVTPPLLTAGFPPGTACLVAGLVGAAQICGPEVHSVTDALGLGDGIPIPVAPDGEVAQPVVPGTTPVGMLGGQTRYASLLQLALPALPAGQGFGSFELILHQDGLNFASESPAVRALVLAALSQVEEQDPAVFAEEVTGALTSGELTTETVTGIEACPARETWAGGDAQGAAADGTRLPDVNCVLGTTGEYDAAAGTWTFDLTFAAQAWTEGAPGAGPLPNEGIVLRPVGAPNLAYGDPDLSTNWVVSVGDSGAAEASRPLIRYSTIALDDPGSAATPPIVTDLPDLSPGASPSFSPPAVAVTPRAPSIGAVLSGALTAHWGDRTSTAGSGSLPAWVWLAVPLTLAGAALFGQALLAPATATRRRPGALSRLVAADQKHPSDPSPRS